jgi:hypothetical protein
VCGKNTAGVGPSVFTFVTSSLPRLRRRCLRRLAVDVKSADDALVEVA